MVSDLLKYDSIIFDLVTCGEIIFDLLEYNTIYI